MKIVIDEPRPFLFNRDQYYRMGDLGWFTNQKVELIGGQVLVHPGPEIEPPGPDVLPSRRWNKDEYYQMLDFGWFQDRRVELLGGEIIEMASQKNYHGAALTLTADALRCLFGVGYWVRVQLSLDLSPWSVPDPDVAVVTGSPRGIRSTAANPTTALLVAEVSDSSLQHDRNVKGSLYAAAGIGDYWIVNLVNRQLEVYRDPVADTSALYGASYSTRLILDPGDFVTPLAAPNARIPVADLLP
jgi:Uma2 family endonuclease